MSRPREMWLTYPDESAERYVAEPPKRVAAPERTPFERDRARVVHAAASRRLAAKTQVVGPQSDDFVRNRLTHSLEVAQIGRDLARAIGCEPDIVETAALAHDLGHPPYGHNGEQALAELSASFGGFEGNAQTLRVLTRLEAKTFAPDGRSVGLNLTRATLDACTKYPWGRDHALPAAGTNLDGSERVVVKFGVYDDDRTLFEWVRQGAPEIRQCLEAQVMDLADDVAYSVHDVEDGIVAGRIDLTSLDVPAVIATVHEWYAPGVSDDALAEAVTRLRRIDAWPTRPYDGTRAHLAQLKNLTSDIIGVFCGAVREATMAWSAGPFLRHEANVVVPEETRLEIAMLKGIAAHYVMATQERVAVMETQREQLHELVTFLWERPEALDATFADDWARAGDDASRRRVVIDQVASLTDASAAAWHAGLVRGRS